MTYPGKNALDGSVESTGSTQLQDVQWITCLFEPELDFLISLKELAIRRAKNAGYRHLGDKFDLRMLHALGFILLEFLKERVQSSSENTDSAEILRLLDGCGLSILNSKETSESNAPSEGTNDLSFISPRRKRTWDGLCEETPKRHKRQKTADASK